ncbi:MAG: hypothetical protein ACI8PT_004240, partial [Gammaproteobacteria bacterium]
MRERIPTLPNEHIGYCWPTARVLLAGTRQAHRFIDNEWHRCCGNAGRGNYAPFERPHKGADPNLRDACAKRVQLRRAYVVGELCIEHA